MFAGEGMYAREPNAEQELPTFKWNEEAADFLLDAYHMRRHLFGDPQIRRKDLWIEILHEMQANGFEVADEQALDRKMRNFKIKYKSVKDMMRRGQDSKWRYLPKLDEIFSSDSIVEHSLQLSPKESIEEPPTKKKRPSNTIQKKQVIVEESKWDEKTVNFLLDAYHKRKDFFCAPKARKKLLWCEILKEMRVAGFQVEHKEELDRKMRNLKKTYRMLKERISIGGGQTRWPYVDKMDAIFSDDCSINYDPSISLIESSEETTFVDKSASSVVASPVTSSSQEPPAEIIASSTEIVDLSAEIMDFSNSVNGMGNEQLIVEEHKEKARGGMAETLKEPKILLKERNYLLKQLNVPAQGSNELDESPCKTSDFTFEFINTTSEAFDPDTRVKNERPSNKIQKKQVIVAESKWDEKTLNFLLDAYHKRKDLFCDPKQRKKLLWCEILQEMRVAGFQVEHKEALDRKMRNMKKTYRMLKERISIGGGQTTWPYVDKMDAIFSDDCSINYDPSISLIESSEETTFVDKSASSVVASPVTSSSQEPPADIIASSTEIVDLSDEMMGLWKGPNRMRKKQMIVEERKEKARGGMHDTLKESKILLKERNYLLKQLNVPAQDSDELDEFPCKTSDFTFEFINTTPEAFDPDIHVKNEPIECEEVDDYNNESSCGEIRLSFSGTFVLVCGFCHEKHSSLIDFGLHLTKRHEGHLKSTIAVECLDTTKVEDVEAVYVIQNDIGYKHGEQKSSKICNNCGKSFIYIENFRSHECERASGNVTKAKTFAESIERNNVSETVNETFAESIDELLTKRNNVSEVVNVPLRVKPEHEEHDLSTNETQAKNIQREGKILPLAFDPQTRQCKFCGQEFETKTECSKHEDAHVGEKLFSCWYCQQTFRTQSGRDYHVRMHTGERPFKCTECTKSFAHRRQLDKHICQQHKDREEFPCLKCGKVFFSKSSLNHHERRHNLLPQTHICEHCGKVFKAMSLLKDHLKRHTGNRDCICVECGMGFYSKPALQRHMAKHTKQTQFECDVCGMKFSRYTGLLNHLKYHSEEKFACKICGKSYVALWSLHYHMRSHRVKFSDADT